MTLLSIQFQKYLLHRLIIGQILNQSYNYQRLPLATFSIYSFFLRAQLDWMLFFSTLMSSSAKHSAMVLVALYECSLAPWVIKQMAWLTLLKGETSTACFLTTPPAPILVESSLGPANNKALTTTYKGFLPVSKWMISNVCLTILMALAFLPVFLPWN